MDATQSRPEAAQSEWAWFRQSLAEALFRPRRFAATLPREHYGLAGVLVVIGAGVTLSVGVDAAVVLSKGADPLAMLSRLAVDALLLGVRLAVVVAVVAIVAIVLARARSAGLSLDQAFTALAFAASPLLFSPIVPVLLAGSGEVPSPARAVFLAPAGVTAALIVARVVYGAALNLAALVGGRAALALSLVILAASGLILQDQVGRVVFTALTYAPAVLPPPAATAASGREERLDGLTLRLSAEWKEAGRGIPGEAGRFETPDARLVISRKGVSALTTADAFAAGEVQATLRDYTRIERAERRLVRIDDVVAIDDRWYGWIDEVRLVQRLYTLVLGRRGYRIEFRYFRPADEQAALDEAARIAASIRLAR